MFFKAGWVIQTGNDYTFVPFNPDTAGRASRRTNYLPVAEAGMDIDKGTITTGSGENFLIKETRFDGYSYSLERA